VRRSLNRRGKKREEHGDSCNKGKKKGKGVRRSADKEVPVHLQSGKKKLRSSEGRPIGRQLSLRGKEGCQLFRKKKKKEEADHEKRGEEEKGPFRPFACLRKKVRSTALAPKIDDHEREVSTASVEEEKKKERCPERKKNHGRKLDKEDTLAIAQV